MTASHVLIAVFVLVAVSCERKKPLGIKYEEISHEQSVTETTAAFSENGEKIEVEKDIESFFTRFGRTTRSDKTIDISNFISMDAMIETAEAAKAFDGMNSLDKRNFQRGFRRGITNLDNAFKQMAYDRHRIVRVEKPAENRRVVFVVQYDNDLNASQKMRWWLVRTKEGWRIHDFEDLSVGLRMVSLIASVTKAGVGKKPEPWIADFLPVAQSMTQIDFGDAESMSGMREPMQRLLNHDLPLDIRRFASAILVSAYLAAEEIDKAEQELQAAEKGGYQSPLADYLTGHLMMRREEWSKALEAFDRNIAIMGADSDILELISDCHYQLDEMEAARNAALKGLDDNPLSVNCLACLAAASTPEQIAEPGFATRFTASGEPENAYEKALDYLVSLEEMEKAKALFVICRPHFKDPETIEYYEETLSGKTEE